MESSASPAGPEGFVPHTRRSPLTDPWQPLFARPLSVNGRVSWQLAVMLREAHCNGRGLAHGGLIAALADNAMGLSAVASAQLQRPEVSGAVTVGLTLDYLDAARPGEWLHVDPTVLKCGGSMAFVECHVHAAGRPVARASATFRWSTPP